MYVGERSHVLDSGEHKVFMDHFVSLTENNVKVQPVTSGRKSTTSGSKKSATLGEQAATKKKKDKDGDSDDDFDKEIISKSRKRMRCVDSDTDEDCVTGNGHQAVVILDDDEDTEL